MDYEVPRNIWFQQSVYMWGWFQYFPWEISNETAVEIFTEISEFTFNFNPKSKLLHLNKQTNKETWQDCEIKHLGICPKWTWALHSLQESRKDLLKSYQMSHKTDISMHEYISGEGVFFLIYNIEISFLIRWTILHY